MIETSLEPLIFGPASQPHHAFFWHTYSQPEDPFWRLMTGEKRAAESELVLRVPHSISGYGKRSEEEVSTLLDTLMGCYYCGQARGRMMEKEDMKKRICKMVGLLP